MDDLSRETAAIMPLAESRQELDGTVTALKSLWFQHHAIGNVAIQLANQDIRQIILVGSGDSLAVAELVGRDMERLLAMPCRAYQSYEFINDADYLLNQHCLVIAISASGRPSPILEALKVAARSEACTIGITNQPGNEFSQLPDCCLFTGAVKKGIPTQSTTATLFLLSLLAVDMAFYQKKISPENYDSAVASLLQAVDNLPHFQKASRDYWQAQDRSLFFNRQITFLSTGSCAAVASLASNLLACGPQIFAGCFLLEEYHHSLRLLQVKPSQYFMIFMPESAAKDFVMKTAATLERAGAKATVVSTDYYRLIDSGFPSPDGVSAPSPADLNRNINFYHLVFLQELSLRLANDFINQGGIRASLNNG